MSWAVEILNKAVQKELESLPKDLKAKFLHIAEMLEEFGPQNVREPFVKPLKFKKSNLWEMRMKGKSGIARAIYITITKERIVVLHAFIKKTQKTPQQALKTAIKRLEEIK
jgi:phage-related protein